MINKTLKVDKYKLAFIMKTKGFQMINASFFTNLLKVYGDIIIEYENNKWRIDNMLFQIYDNEFGITHIDIFSDEYYLELFLYNN